MSLFRFRQFSMHHHRSTMKIGTDAVLLGIWTAVEGATTILDVGTGSGVIALLLASRASHAAIDAVDIDEDSCREAAENFDRSPFKERMRVFHDDFQRFSASRNEKYDLIVSNPPFFVNDMPSSHAKKVLARHTQTMDYRSLLKGAVKLLAPGGNFSLVLPYAQKQFFVSLAAERGLYLQREMLIFPKPCYPPNRINMQFGFEKTGLRSEKFVIRNEDGSFTPMYKAFVGDYYISVK